MEHYERTIHGRELNENGGTRHQFVKTFMADSIETLEVDVNVWFEICCAEPRKITVVSRHYTAVADNHLHGVIHYSIVLFFIADLDTN